MVLPPTERPALMAKIVSILKHRSMTGRTAVYSGTIEQLRSDVFGYTLEVGASWDPKVNRTPKTARSLVTALNRSGEASGSYDSYELACGADLAAAEADGTLYVR